MVSAYGLLDNLTRVVVGPTIGGYVDRHERMPGCKIMLRLQNCCIGGSAAAGLALLWPGSAALTTPALYWPLIWVLTVLGAASSAGSTGVQIAVEREAVKALCGDDAGALAAINATMRAIDLTALLLAPLAAGVLMTAAGPFAAAAAMSAYCCLAYIPEVLLLAAAFRAAPALMRPKATAVAAAAAAAADAESERAGLLAASGRAGSVDGLSRVGSIQKPLIVSRGSSVSASSSAFGGRVSGDGQGDGEAPGGGLEGDGLLQPGGGGGGSQEQLSGLPEEQQEPQLPTSTLLPAQRSASVRSLDGVHTAEAEAEAAAGGAGGGSGSGSGLLGRREPRGRGGGGSAAARVGALVAAAGRAAAEYRDSWRVYVQQPLLLPCLALALIYMTVLSLGFLMTSFLKWTGLTEAEVSVYRGIGALTGLAATVLFPPLSKWAGLRFCAAAGITYQLACLSAGVLPVALTIMSHGGGKPSVGQVRVMVGGLVSSRTGLWMYDLAVTQLIQQGVAEEHMGAVYGVQSSLQATFEMLSFVAGLLSPDPARFHWLMLGSVCSVGAAASLVWVYVCSGPRQQGHGGSSGGGGQAAAGAPAAAGGKVGAASNARAAAVVVAASGGAAGAPRYQAVPSGDEA
ncbi:hypothetical protein HYH02_003854 [Chlamydomonas schloesseri]|uniref:Solute carrier family 40 member n=1 Tax=Chlamydomonas schloesseri TaxID=2026947 RepID=A0A835WPS9_9CHLO|nr:hypothetical protein HYH02_003854 [Chlamydomonas schloesseri]|eukprot:KAG2451247.1 hypothetical protein HYH02_003854 [Chlamydomonas schloesseri]